VGSFTEKRKNTDGLQFAVVADLEITLHQATGLAAAWRYVSQ